MNNCIISVILNMNYLLPRGQYFLAGCPCRSQRKKTESVTKLEDNSIRSLGNTYMFTPVYNNKGMRHAAYPQFIMCRHGHLVQKGDPSCCVTEIRKHYPPTDGHKNYIHCARQICLYINIFIN